MKLPVGSRICPKCVKDLQECLALFRWPRGKNDDGIDVQESRRRSDHSLVLQERLTSFSWLDT